MKTIKELKALANEYNNDRSLLFYQIEALKDVLELIKELGVDMGNEVVIREEELIARIEG